MAGKPLVTICIPVYNNQDYISETMRSALSSDYPEIELVIVDDNSKDDSLSVIRRAASELVKDGKAAKVYDFSLDDSESVPEKLSGHTISIYHNEKNLGMSGNWNRCLSLSHGEYIKLLCADDLIDESLIYKEAAILTKYPEVLSVESDTEFKDSEGKSQGYYRRYKKSGIVDGKEIAKYSLFHRDYFGAPLANMFRRSSYEKYGGFDSDFSYIIDYEFFMRLGCAGKVYIIHKPLNFFRIREDSNTGEVLQGDKGKAYIKEHEALVRKYQEVLKLSDFDVKRSVQIRKIMNILGRLYLKVHL